MEKIKEKGSMVEPKKNKEQIKAFISTVKAKTNLDKLKIEKYCSHLGVKIEFIQHEEITTEVTLNEFISWVSQGLPHRGDIIVLSNGNLLCIVKQIGITKITVTAILNPDNELSLKDREIGFCPFRNAELGEQKKLQRELCKKDLAWTNYTYCLKRRFYPKEGEFVRISLLGHKIGLGVFRRVDETGNAIMYCVKMQGHPLRFHLNETIGHISEIQFEKISVQNRQVFIQELEESHLLWNGHAKRIEPLNYRLKEGKLYSFINDYFEIIYTHDYYRQKDTFRLNAGNYFRTHSEATDMLSIICSKLQNKTSPRVQLGEHYYYIDTTFSVTQTKDNYKPKDLKRYTCKNYFTASIDANEFCLLISEFRKTQFYSFSEVIPKSRKANKQKSQVYKRSNFI